MVVVCPLESVTDSGCARPGSSVVTARAHDPTAPVAGSGAGGVGVQVHDPPDGTTAVVTRSARPLRCAASAVEAGPELAYQVRVHNLGTVPSPWSKAETWRPLPPEAMAPEKTGRVSSK